MRKKRGEVTKQKTPNLVSDVKGLIHDSREFAARTLNSTMTLLYWKVGRRINEEVLKHRRAEYGKNVVLQLALELQGSYGDGFSEKNLRRMMQFADLFPDEDIVLSAIRQLSWTHFIALLPIRNPLEREFYTEICRIEGWNVKTLREKIGSMLFERTAISRKPEETIRADLKRLRDCNELNPELVFRDRYILEFLGLEDTYSEKDFESAILRHIEKFILEIGTGFLFMARQKRFIIDGEDHYLDLLFYHRRLRRLLAIDLKLTKFKAAYKAQMELYLRMLQKDEMLEWEEPPLGLIQCAEGNEEQIQMLELDKSGIRVANYMTAVPDFDKLRVKLQAVIDRARKESKVQDKQGR